MLGGIRCSAVARLRKTSGRSTVVRWHWLAYIPVCQVQRCSHRMRTWSGTRDTRASRAIEFSTKRGQVGGHHRTARPLTPKAEPAAGMRNQHRTAFARAAGQPCAEDVTVWIHLDRTAVLIDGPDLGCSPSDASRHACNHPGHKHSYVFNILSRASLSTSSIWSCQASWTEFAHQFVRVETLSTKLHRIIPAISTIG